MTALAREEQLDPVVRALHVELGAERGELAHPVGTFVDERVHRVGVAQAGAGRQRVGKVQVGRIRIGRARPPRHPARNASRNGRARPW